MTTTACKSVLWGYVLQASEHSGQPLSTTLLKRVVALLARLWQRANGRQALAFQPTVEARAWMQAGDAPCSKSIRRYAQLLEQLGLIEMIATLNQRSQQQWIVRFRFSLATLERTLQRRRDKEDPGKFSAPTNTPEGGSPTENPPEGSEEPAGAIGPAAIDSCAAAPIAAGPTAEEAAAAAVAQQAARDAIRDQLAALSAARQTQALSPARQASLAAQAAWEEEQRTKANSRKNQQPNSRTALTRGKPASWWRSQSSWPEALTGGPVR